MVGGLESKAAEKGLLEMLKVHPDAKRICRKEFKAQGVEVRCYGRATIINANEWDR